MKLPVLIILIFATLALIPGCPLVPDNSTAPAGGAAPMEIPTDGSYTSFRFYHTTKLYYYFPLTAYSKYEVYLGEHNYNTDMNIYSSCDAYFDENDILIDSSDVDTGQDTVYLFDNHYNRYFIIELYVAGEHCGMYFLTVTKHSGSYYGTDNFSIDMTGGSLTGVDVSTYNYYIIVITAARTALDAALPDVVITE